MPARSRRFHCTPPCPLPRSHALASDYGDGALRRLPLALVLERLDGRPRRLRTCPPRRLSSRATGFWPPCAPDTARGAPRPPPPPYPPASRSLCAAIFPSLHIGGGPWPAGSTNLPKSSRRGSGSSRPPKTPLPCLQRRWRLTRDGTAGYTITYRKSKVTVDSKTRRIYFVFRHDGGGACAHSASRVRATCHAYRMAMGGRSGFHYKPTGIISIVPRNPLTNIRFRRIRRLV